MMRQSMLDIAYLVPCDEIRLSVEFVTVGFLGICRQYCCDWFPVCWRADEATPERGTPIIEC